MKNVTTKLTTLIFAVLLVAVAKVAVAQDLPPDDISGKWTIYAKDPDGRTSAKYIDVQQDGTTIKGHFKGPYQSGGIEGSINGHHVLFRTKTRDVLTFRGEVNGNTITGTFHARRGTGEWQAVRP